MNPARFPSIPGRPPARTANGSCTPRLAEISRLPTVELGIIPADTDMPSRYGVSFDLYDKLDGTDDAVVVVELETEELRVYQREQIEAYRRRHDIYWTASLTGEAAENWLHGTANELMR